MALPNTNITVGAPPLMWSDVHEAFRQVNENFDSVAAALGVAGITPIDFETLDTSLKPTSTEVYSLGDITHKWTSVYTGEYSAVSPLNGLWAGNAQIKGVGTTINLPAGSTIGGDPLSNSPMLIIDPEKTFFKTVQVDAGTSVVANDFADTINLNSGTAINLVADSLTKTVTVNNDGVTQLTAGSGTSVSGSTGSITITNTGVRSLTSTTSLPSGRTAGAGINIDNSTGDGIKITNTGVISIVSGVGITVAADSATGEVQIINSAPAGSAFAYVEVNGDSGDRIAADLVGDVLNITSGTGITLTKNTTTDTLNISVNPVFDLTGNVSGNAGTVTNGVYTTGSYANPSWITSLAASKVGLGNVENTALSTSTYYIGTTQNTYGRASASQTLTGVSIDGNAGTVTNGVYTSGSYSDPSWLTISKTKVGLSNVENTALSTWAGSSNITTVGTLDSLSVTNNIGAGSFTGNIFTSLIDSSDSTAITVTPKMIFSSDVDVENELRVRGSLMISVSQLKSIAAASADFTAFKAAIALLAA